MPYVAIVNTPGYLPDMVDEPAVFETAREAWEYLVEERNRAWNETEDGGPDFDPLMDQMDKWAKSDLVCDFEKVSAGIGSFVGPTPGYAGNHDLGVAYSVEYVADEDVL